MERTDEYCKHLASPEWRKLRKKKIASEGCPCQGKQVLFGQCKVCGGSATIRIVGRFWMFRILCRE
jgi:hypothetical protein